MGFLFQGLALRQGQLPSTQGQLTKLLTDMGQFVHQQSDARLGLGLKLACSEKDAGSHRKGIGLKLIRQSGSRAVGMNPDTAQIEAHPLFQMGT